MTIISGVIMLILFVSELQYYLTKEVSPSTSPDDLITSTSGQNAPGEIKIDFYLRGNYNVCCQEKEVVLSDLERCSRACQLNSERTAILIRLICLFYNLLVTFCPLMST